MKVITVIDLSDEELNDDAIIQEVDAASHELSARIREQIEATQGAVCKSFDIQIQRATGTRRLNVNEISSLTAVIHYRADYIGCSPLAIELAVQDAFMVDEIGALQAKMYTQAMEFIIDWNGIN